MILLRDTPQIGEEIINDINGKEIIEIFYEKELQKTNQQEFRIEKLI